MELQNNNQSNSIQKVKTEDFSTTPLSIRIVSYVLVITSIFDVVGNTVFTLENIIILSILPIFTIVSAFGIRKLKSWSLYLLTTICFYAVISLSFIDTPRLANFLLPIVILVSVIFVWFKKTLFQIKKDDIAYSATNNDVQTVPIYKKFLSVLFFLIAIILCGYGSLGFLFGLALGSGGHPYSYFELLRFMSVAIIIFSPSAFLIFAGIKLISRWSTKKILLISVVSTIILIIVSTIAILFWFNYKDRNNVVTIIQPEENAPMSNKLTNSIDLVSGTVYDVTWLGVKFTLPNTLSDLTSMYVKFPNEQSVETVGFSTKRLENQGCDAISGPLGFLTYHNDQGGELVGYARNSNLYYIKPDGKCMADPSLQNWQLLQESLKSLTTD